MKTKILVVLSLLLPTLAHAGGTMTCHYPSSCKQITSSEYSTGGGDKVVQYMEMDCITTNGSYVKYIDRIGSVGGAFGFGRLTQPDKVVFIKWNKDELQCKK